MPEARIGGQYEHLLLTPPEPGTPTSAMAVLALGGLNAVTTVEQRWDGGFMDLARFFSSMEQAWRGWTGTRTWQSAEGELNLDAYHHGGRIQLKVTVRRWAPGPGSDGWTASGDILIEPGEELTLIAREVAAFADGV